MTKVPVGYVRTQAVGAGLANMVLNPLIEWLLNKTRSTQPLWGADGVVGNLVITSIILSVLVALFAALGVRRETHTGRIGSGTAFGLLLGIGAGAVVVLACWVAHALGVSGLSFVGLLVLKALYCGILGFLVARAVITRQLRG